MNSGFTKNMHLRMVVQAVDSLVAASSCLYAAESSHNFQLPVSTTWLELRSAVEQPQFQAADVDNLAGAAVSCRAATV